MKKFNLLLSIPLMAQLCYFVSLSFTGFLALKVSKSRYNVINSPHNLDLLFMSVSASTGSSMGTVEMEVFSNQQLWVLIFLMLFGGEIFTSMLGLYITKFRLKRTGSTPPERLESSYISDISTLDKECMEYNAIRYLASIVLAYLVIVIVTGSVLISLYIVLVPRATEVLERKEIEISTFSIFMAASSFVNCGFTPTNENMMPFRKNSILQLLIVCIVLAGNTLFPPCLRSLTFFLKKLTKSKYYNYILENPRNIGYEHIFAHEESVYLTSTVFGFVVIQIVLFCSLEWNSESLKELKPCQKLVAALFQSVNARHAGESVIDLQMVSSAVLVLYIVMMYLPSYTRYLPYKDDDKTSTNEDGNNGGSLSSWGAIMPQFCYPVIFTILVCVTERRAIVEDPLNFNVLSIVFEIISAYGNVGFSLGYSCKRLLTPDGSCNEAWYGFVGRWSTKGKIVLILVMIFGKLKKFSMNGNKAWKL